MSNIEKIKAEIKRLKNKNAEWRERINSEDGYSYESDVCCGYDEAIEDFESFINSLPEEKPIEKDEEMEALIACDIMEATVKRVIIDKQDKDKEEEAMLEKINYLINLGLNE